MFWCCFKDDAVFQISVRTALLGMFNMGVVIQWLCYYMPVDKVYLWMHYFLRRHTMLISGCSDYMLLFSVSQRFRCITRVSVCFLFRQDTEGADPEPVFLVIGTDFKKEETSLWVMFQGPALHTPTGFWTLFCTWMAFHRWVFSLLPHGNSLGLKLYL